MKKIAALVIILFLFLRADSQMLFSDSIAYSRNRTTEKAMIVLGSWAALNIASGFIIAGQTQGEAKYFWQMNAYWNLVNGGLAVMGYIGARKAMLKKYDLAENEKAQLSMEKLYAFNLGLDLAYITGGFFLREKGNNTSSIKSQDQLRGYGTSVIVQGGFLLLMDGVMIMLHHKNSIRLNNKLRNLETGIGPGGLGLTYTF